MTFSKLNSVRHKSRRKRKREGAGEEREEEGKTSDQLSQIAQEREQSLYWWASPWFSKCGPWNREISIIWEFVTDGNSWPYHWSTEWGSLELGHCNLSFNQLSRWWSQGKELKKWVLLKLPEKLFLLKRLILLDLGLRYYMLQIYKTVLFLVFLIPRNNF